MGYDTDEGQNITFFLVFNAELLFMLFIKTIGCSGFIVALCKIQGSVHTSSLIGIAHCRILSTEKVSIMTVDTFSVDSIFSVLW